MVLALRPTAEAIFYWSCTAPLNWGQVVFGVPNGNYTVPVIDFKGVIRAT
jgi:hypothetical protein